MNHTPTPWKYEAMENSCEVFTSSPKYKNVASYVDETNAEFIVRACNSYDRLISALKSASLTYKNAGIPIPNSWNELLLEAEGKTE